MLQQGRSQALTKFFSRKSCQADGMRRLLHLLLFAQRVLPSRNPASQYSAVPDYRLILLNSSIDWTTRKDMVSSHFFPILFFQNSKVSVCKSKKTHSSSSELQPNSMESLCAKQAVWSLRIRAIGPHPMTATCDSPMCRAICFISIRISSTSGRPWCKS